MSNHASTLILAIRRNTSRPMSRDKADTLLLLISCALVLLPHAAHLPVWVSLMCATMLLWRGWITFRGNRMPPQWLLLLVSASSLAAVYFSFHQFFGRDPGVAMVLLLLTLKLLEMHAKRDLFVVVLVSFFVMLTNFFYSQTIGTAVMMAAALVAMLTTQLSFQYVNAVPPLMQRLRLGALIFGLSIPLALVSFLLFPRIEGPLWGLPTDANSGKTGLSSTMSPGSLSDLAQSDDIAFRVKFSSLPPPQSQLYWRALVLDNYDGRTWTHSQHYFPRNTNLEIVESKAIKYQVTLEPTGQNWLFAIDVPRAVQSDLAGNQATINPDMQIRTSRPVSTRLHYDVLSYPDYKFQADATPADLREWLQLPPGYNPQTLAFAERLHSQSNDDGVLINTVLNFFRKQAFRYTLQPPLLGDNAIDEFLFTTQAGFCEHYAGSFVFLMRAMGIPARVVIGYQGGEMNPVDGYMEIRQSDAHAWAEAWLPRRGWVRIDPTAAVAPERVEKNLSSVIPRTVLGGLITLNTGKDSWLSKWRFNTAAISNAWNQWVLSYSSVRQRSLLQSLGFENPDWQTMITLMAALSAAVVALIAIPLVMKRQKIDPLQALYNFFCQELARSGYPREKHEGPRDYRLRLTAADSTLTPTRKLAVGRFLQLYEALRYAALEPQHAKGGFSQLKSLLSECK